MKEKAIGVFDSGLGGLTAVKRLMELAPTEDIIFFGDTARVPYGTRTAKAITQFAVQDISFLLEHDVKMVIAACGTVSSTLSDAHINMIPRPYVGVVQPTALAAAAATRNRKIGILGTSATIRSGAFERALHAIAPSIVAVSGACPLFVPLVENGYTARDCDVTRQVAQEYLKPLRDAGVDTIILGCTHYPIISEIIADIMGDVSLIDSGFETAKYALSTLDQTGMRNNSGGTRRFFTSDNPDGFTALAELFLGCALKDDVHPAPLENIRIHPCFQANA